MSRAKTPEEVREIFLSQVRTMCKYWAELPDKTPRERCDGLAFSILSTIDGASLDIPAFDMIPCPHPEDKQYCIENGLDWYEPVVMNDCQLHEMFYKEDEEQ
jgi:hypothetical protein